MPARVFARRLLFLIATVVIAVPAAGQIGELPPPEPLPLTPVLSKLDPLLQQRLSDAAGRSLVIVRAIDASSIDAVALLIQETGGVAGRQLPILEAIAADVPNASLAALTNSPLVRRVALDRLILGTVNRIAATIGAAAVRQELGYNGSGVGVAVIDSGITAWHDDLTAAGTPGSQRVDQFVDFVNGRLAPYDDYGHGTHVAGVIAGNGADSTGSRAGIAPGARLIALKVLDGSGRGRISDVIAALGYVVEHRQRLNIRVVNLSIGTGVFESYESDLLTLAAKRVVDAGVVVVAAAGNLGKDGEHRRQYGGITAPGNAPWVLTVGAYSHMGTIDRADDIIAGFSSRGPTAIDRAAKPDLVAPGVGVVSLSDPNSFLFHTRPGSLLAGSIATTYLPYLSLSGTSQAAPVVAGTVALMLQANPELTPNAVKAILQYTAEAHAAYDALTQGAGFVNARGAVELAQFLAAPYSYADPHAPAWSAQLIWGNQRVRAGRLTLEANAWRAEVAWGAATTPSGEAVEWGVVDTVSPRTNDNSANQTAADCADTNCYSVAWRVDTSYTYENVVWGVACNGGDCHDRGWSVYDTTVVWGTSEGETVVWGTTDSETVVWGTTDSETVVWGTSNEEDVVWDKCCAESEETPAN